MFSRINLQTELIRERIRLQRMMNEVHEILDASAQNDEDVLQRLRGQESKKELWLNLDDSELSDVFKLEEIRDICIRYRLRFLDARFFKAEYPYEAVARIHAFEKKHGIVIRNFKIIAPDHTFDLQDINKDPMLFAQLDNERFLLLHKWGKDLAWHKRISMWPFRNFKTYFISLWITAFLFAVMVPVSVMSIFNFESEFYLRTWLMIHIFIGLFGFTMWAGLSFDKTFSNLNWDSKYSNY